MGAHQPSLEHRHREMDPRQELAGGSLVAPKEGCLMDAAFGPNGKYPSQPFVCTTLPGSTDSPTKGIRLSAEASGTHRILIRPMPFFPLERQ